MDLSNLKKFAETTLKTLDNNEKFFVTTLESKARQLTKDFPNDQTLIGLCNFLSRRAESSLFISRAELKEVYSKLYTANNKFGEFFADELALEKKEPTNRIQHHPNEGSDFVKDSYEKLADPILKNALVSLFDKESEYKPYSEEMAKAATKACLHELNCSGVLPKKVESIAGQEDIIVCQASYDTPKGQSYVVVPVEIKDKKALSPSMFLSVEGFVELNKSNLSEHLQKTAGKSYKLDIGQLVGQISNIKNGSQEVISNVERIVLKAKTAGINRPVLEGNNVTGLLVDAESPNLKLPEVERPAEVIEISKRLDSAAGMAELVFGKNVVDKGRRLVSNTIKSFGFKNSQISVNDAKNDTIVFAVALDNQNGVSIPVKVSKNSITLPDFIVAKSGLYEFSREGLNDLLKEGGSDNRALAVASPLFGLGARELIETIRSAMASGDHLKAEDALGVLQTMDNQEALAAGYQEYKNGLLNKPLSKEAAQKEVGCKAIVKNSNSKYLICSHTGLPIHKVYQNEHGDCLPLYRRGMKHDTEGATFMHSKICWD